MALKWDLKVVMTVILQTMMGALPLALSKLDGTAQGVQFIKKTLAKKSVEMDETLGSISVKVETWLIMMAAIRTADKK